MADDTEPIAADKSCHESASPSPSLSQKENNKALLCEADYELSPIPEKCNGVGVTLGIDEAGRGAVYGPMVYAAAYWPINENEAIEKLGFDDSKALKEGERERLHAGILKESDRIGWVICELSSSMIATKMLQRTPVSLNEMSHDAAIGMIQRVIDAGVDVQEIYVDTVGNAERYEQKLCGIFGSRAKVVVRAKADSLFKVVSAASICAKVTRDHSVAKWVHPEKAKGVNFGKLEGSGYPGDARTRSWLAENTDPVFGYPVAVRFSWSTVRNVLEPDAVATEASKWAASSSSSSRGPKKATSTATTIVARKRTYPVEWEEEDNAERNMMAAFCSAKPKPAKRFAKFLSSRGFSIVSAPSMLMGEL